MLRGSISPSARNDPAYIQMLANAVAQLQNELKMTIAQPKANYLANTPNEVILADASTGSLTVSLPEVKAFQGYTVFVKKMDSTANAVTLQAKTAETIDGLNTKAIVTQFMSLTVLSTGTEWVVI